MLGYYGRGFEFNEIDIIEDKPSTFKGNSKVNVDLLNSDGVWWLGDTLTSVME